MVKERKRVVLVRDKKGITNIVEEKEKVLNGEEKKVYQVFIGQKEGGN